MFCQCLPLLTLPPQRSNYSNAPSSTHATRIKPEAAKQFSTQTHEFFGIPLSNMYGEDERPSSATNYVFNVAHGTDPGGASGILKSRMILRSFDEFNEDASVSYETFGFFGVASWDTTGLPALQFLANRLVRMGKGQHMCFFTGIAQSGCRHATRDAGSTADDQRDCLVSGLCHNKPSGRWAIREDLMTTNHIWFGQAIPTARLQHMPFRRKLSNHRPSE